MLKKVDWFQLFQISKNPIRYCILLVIFGYSCQGNLTVKWWTSTPKKNFEEQRNILIESIDSVKNFDVEIFVDSLQQEIQGFGGCFNEMGWEALSTLSNKDRENVLALLFNPNKGLSFTVCRLPIGASDYAKSYYSLDDSVNDYSLEYFNIERDKNYLIPYIKAAMQHQKNIELWASPWTPPAWMKTNNNYACAVSPQNKFEPEGKEGTDQIKVNDTIFRTYAKYFSKYIKAYREEGIEISAVHVQNEFNSCQIFPSCTWTTSSLSKFIGGFLGPQFKKDRINSDIWFGTIERPSVSIIDSVLQDENCKKYIKGLGFQWAGKGAVGAAKRKYPELSFMQTESECGDGSNDWKAAEYTFDLMKLYLDSGVNSYMYWNMVLEQSGKSAWGWRQNSLISIDTIYKKVKLNPEYYLFKHISHFVSPGSVKIKTEGKFNDILAFITPGNDLIIIIANKQSRSSIIRIKIEDKMIETLVPKKSFNTFIYMNAV